MPDVRIRVVELMDTVLSTFDRQIGEFTAQQFKRSGGQVQMRQHACVPAAAAQVSMHVLSAFDRQIREFTAQQFKPSVGCLPAP